MGADHGTPTHGEWGNVAVTAQLLTDSGKYKAAPEGTRKADRWRTRARVRDADGIVRDVERYDATKTEARRVLEESLRERVAPVTKGSISGSTTFEELAQQWAEGMRSSDDHAANTKAVYSSVLNRYVLSSGPQ